MDLHYQDLCIRNATIEDAKQLEIWWNDGKVMAHAGFPNGTGQTEEEIAMKLQTDVINHQRCIIMYKNQAIGECNYRNIGDDTAEIGIKICDFTLHNKGLGKIILSMLIESLFNDLGFKKIVLDTNFNNKRAQHVYEQLGFHQVRINVDAWKNQLGELQTSIDYELFPHQFHSYKN